MRLSSPHSGYTKYRNLAEEDEAPTRKAQGTARKNPVDQAVLIEKIVPWQTKL
jgi:hypothetical protein